MPDCDIGTHIQENKQQQANLQKWSDVLILSCTTGCIYVKRSYVLRRLSDIYEYIHDVPGTCFDYGTLGQQNPRIPVSFSSMSWLNCCTKFNPHIPGKLYTFFYVPQKNVKMQQCNDNNIK